MTAATICVPTSHTQMCSSRRRGLESVGTYAPLDVKDDAYEQGKRTKRVGF